HQIWIAVNTEVLREFTPQLDDMQPRCVRGALNADLVADYRRSPRPAFVAPWLPCRPSLVEVDIERVVASPPSDDDLWQRDVRLPADLVVSSLARADIAAFISLCGGRRGALVSALN